MNIGAFFKKNLIHFAVLATFFVAMFTYFSMQFDGYGLKQHDIAMYKGMSNELVHHREATGEEALWTNSMFGGMPATQISVEHKGNIFKEISRFVVRNLPSPSGIFLLHLICFYILGMFLRIKPIIAALGAFAFAFASYEIIILQAGHNSKAMAVAFAPPVIGAFIYAYRRNWKWGAIFSLIFMGFEVAQNHLQVTYYLGILLGGLGLYELINAIKNKPFATDEKIDNPVLERPARLKKFGITTGAIMVGYIIAIFINYGNVKMTNDYAKNTIRGKNEITISPEGIPDEKKTDGLNKEYITNWSYGIGESFTLMSPYVKGSHSIPVDYSEFRTWVEDSDRTSAEKDLLLQPSYMMYHGEQSSTSGPVYLGIVLVFLSLLGIVMLKSPVKWVYLAVSILALMLSWGKNFMGLSEFFIDNIPMYNKFRTVTIILVLIELCMPIIAIMILQKFWEQRETLKEKTKPFLITSGAFILFLLMLKFVGVNDNYSTTKESKAYDEMVKNSEEDLRNQIYALTPAQQQEYRIDIRNTNQVESIVKEQSKKQKEEADASWSAMKGFRSEMESSSWNRSLIFGLLAVLVVALFFYTSIPSGVIVGALGLLLLIDLVPVDKNYLGDVTDPKGNFLHWEDKGDTKYPHAATNADYSIMKMESQNDPTLESKLLEGEKKGKEKAESTDFDTDTKQRIIDSYKFQALNAATNYRVFEPKASFGSARSSYFHKSLGGYHGAKLQNFQNMVEFQLYHGNEIMYDMLNVKYMIYGNEMQPRRTAMGNAWLVQHVDIKKSPAEELIALGAKMKIENLGPGRVLVANKEIKSGEIHLGQTPKYILKNGDTLNVPFDWGITAKLSGYFVLDAKGGSGFVPKQTIDRDTTNGFTQLVKMERSYTFNPDMNAVMLESEAKKLGKTEFTGEGEVKMTSYAPNKITYDANVKGDQLIVFSEIYYKDGWQATVDGKPVDILKVNYLLRGLKVGNGSHKIEFTYDDPTYRASNTMAYIGSIFVFLIVGGMLFLDWKSRKLDSSAE